MDAALIAGPTASGKSAVALAVAQHWNGVIINADSMQVYRELRILTARPSPAEEALAPHKLYGFVPAAEAYSVGRWLEDVRDVLRTTWNEGKLPVIIGGTGLYFKALLEGLSPVPEIPAGIRAHWRGEAARLGAAALHDVLCKRDPEMAARLRASDPQRIVRALEVLDATGRSLASWQNEKGKGVIKADRALRLFLVPDREALYRRCNERFVAMIRAGAIDEAAAVMQLALPASLPAMRAVGLRPLIAHLQGEISLEQAIELGQAETRRYAKRQMTWARSNMISWNLISTQFLERTKQEINIRIAQRLDAPLE